MSDMDHHVSFTKSFVYSSSRLFFTLTKQKILRKASAKSPGSSFSESQVKCVLFQPN